MTHTKIIIVNNMRFAIPIDSDRDIYIFLAIPFDNDRDIYTFIAVWIFIDPNRDLCLLCIIPLHYTVFEIVTRAPPGQALRAHKAAPRFFLPPCLRRHSLRTSPLADSCVGECEMDRPNNDCRGGAGLALGDGPYDCARDRAARTDFRVAQVASLKRVCGDTRTGLAALGPPRALFVTTLVHGSGASVKGFPDPPPIPPDPSGRTWESCNSKPCTVIDTYAPWQPSPAWATRQRRASRSG